MMAGLRRRPTRRALAGVVALGGVLIAAGSQWDLVRDYVSGPPGVVHPHLHVVTPQFSASRIALNVSIWIPIALLLCGIILASLGFDVGSEMPRRVRLGWTLFLIACVATACATAVGMSVIHTATSLGPGFALVACGCVLGLVGSALWCWSVSLQSLRQQPQGTRVAL